MAGTILVVPLCGNHLLGENMAVLFTVIALTLGISAICSLIEATLFSTRVATLEAAKAGGRHVRGAEAMLSMKRDVSSPTSAILILNTIANTAGATIAGMLAAREFGASGVPIFSATLTLAILFLSEILPKTVGAVHWKGLWPVVVWPLALIQHALKPLIWVTKRFAVVFIKGEPPSVTSEAEILAMIRLGAKAGELSPTELELLTSVFYFDEVIVRQIMVPRSEVVFFDIGWPAARYRELIKETRHTRYPLCKDSLDNTFGIIHVKDLAGVSLEESVDLIKLARPLRSVPERMPIRQLLREMQATHRHMVTVVDEYGTAIGIATLENVLEQIVGAVQDEFDDETPEIEEKEKGKYIIHGMTSVKRLNHQLNLALKTPSDIDTISGLLVSKLGRLLVAGDKVQLEGATAEVIDIVGNRAKKIQITVAAPAAIEEPKEGSG